MKVNDFEDLIIYQQAQALATDIYKIVKLEGFRYDGRFKDQIRASVGSIADNIAEGFERQGNKEFKNFLFIAKGSCGEVRSQVTRAHNVGYIDDATFEDLYNRSKKLGGSINAMIQSLKFSEFKGTRYNTTPSEQSELSEHS